MVQDPGKPAPGTPAKQEAPPRPDAPAKAPTGSATTNQPPGKSEQVAPGKQDKTEPEPGKIELGPGVQGTPPQATQPLIPLQTPPGVAGAPPRQAPAEPFQIGSILMPALALVALLVIGALILAWLKRSRQRDALTASTTASDQLATFRHAYEEGEMTPEEFQKVKARLSEKLRERDPVSMPPQARRKRLGDSGADVSGGENT